MRAAAHREQVGLRASHLIWCLRHSTQARDEGRGLVDVELEGDSGVGMRPDP